MVFIISSSYQARPGQPQVLDGDFINEDKLEVIAFELFEEPLLSKTLGGGGGVKH